MEAPETSREPSNLLYSQATERAYRGQLEEVARARDSETAALARVSELEARLSSQTSQLVAAQQLADALQVRFSMFFFNCCFVWGGGYSVDLGAGECVWHVTGWTKTYDSYEHDKCGC